MRRWARRRGAKTEPAAVDGRAPGTPSKRVELVLITGLSGAGKSEAIAAFEDNGYFCVDNLPPRLIEALGELFAHPGSKVERAAVACDVRAGAYFDDLIAVLDELSEGGLRVKVLYLEADEDALVNRFKETRRRHPLSPEGRLLEGIQAERDVLAALRERADVVMDTTELTGATLRRKIATEMLSSDAAGRLAMTILTFGFKSGAPRDADLVFDVRFLPNPHYEPDLRPLTGRDRAVVDFIESGTQLEEYYARLLPLLEFLIPAYVAEGKTHLTLAFGCTGGRHRSVAIAEHVAGLLSGRDDVVVQVVHRDAGLA